MRIGILALQGDFREHFNLLRKLDTNPVFVRSREDLESVDGLIIPGGESTTISLLMRRYGLDKKIREKCAQGMAIYGTCAGAILLSREVIGNNVSSLNLIDIGIERNAYGRQIDSFEAELIIKDIGNFKGIFIRAPVIKKVSDTVQVLAEHNQFPVMAQHNNILVTTFHPELSNDTRVHEYFIKMAREYKEIREMQIDLEKSDS